MTPNDRQHIVYHVYADDEQFQRVGAFHRICGARIKSEAERIAGNCREHGARRTIVLPWPQDRRRTPPPARFESEAALLAFFDAATLPRLGA